MTMGRKRKGGNPLGLEARVEFHHGQFRYLHRDGKKEPLGTDVKRANDRARIYNDTENRYGRLGYWIDIFVADARAGRLHKVYKPRSVEDFEEQAVYLKAAFDKNFPEDLVAEPQRIALYRDLRSKPTVDDEGKVSRGAPVRANRELSLLSSVYAWLIETGRVPGLTVNPVKLIKRNREKPKDKYVEDRDYQAVWAVASTPLRMAMSTIYRTLQRPSDVLALPPSALRDKTVAGAIKRILSVTQSKTGRTVDIEATPDLLATLHMLSKDGELGSIPVTNDGKVRKPVPTLIYNRSKRGYTEEGLGAVLRKACHAAKVPTFGLMDVRAKGATDMYLDRIPLETIQLLMGHASVTTTEIYIKRLLATISIAAPNERKIAG